MVEHDDLERGYCFDGFELLPKSRLLLRDGQKIRIARRALNILLVLIERHERVVSRNEILDEAFPGVLVEDQNVTVHISALRHLLGPAAITTIPGRGYRFTGKLSREDGTAGAATAAEEVLLAIPRTSTNLPHRPPLIGRAAELAELPALTIAHRLVTLVGPGGMGKSSLAIEFGHKIADRFPDGVWLIDLAPLTDPALVAGAAAAVLGVTIRGAEAPAEAIGTAIARQSLLLIFDNCEHVIPATAQLTSILLIRSPGLRVLATSQEVLGLPVELVYRLDPLSLPPLDQQGTGTADAWIGTYSAVALFVARAKAADRYFQLWNDTAIAIATVCRALDGVPLTLEMAAARLPLLGLEGLSNRLGERLKLLRRRPGVCGARYDTLQDMVEWSHGLLQPDDQRMFRRLSVFRGSFSLDAAIAVAAAPETDPWSAIDGLSRLIDKSMVAVEDTASPRYRLLETLRLFALEQLALCNETDETLERATRHFVALFDEAERCWERTSNAEWLSRYQPEIDNIRAVLDWALPTPERNHIALTLAGNAARLWYVSGLIAEGRYYVDRAVSYINDQTPLASVAQLFKQAGNFWHSSDMPKALALQQRAAELYEKINDQENRASILTTIGNIYCVLGDIENAKLNLEKSEKILISAKYMKSLGFCYNGLGACLRIRCRRCVEASYPTW